MRKTVIYHIPHLLVGLIVVSVANEAKHNESALRTSNCKHKLKIYFFATKNAMLCILIDYFMKCIAHKDEVVVKIVNYTEE